MTSTKEITQQLKRNALLSWGNSHMSVDVKCLSIDPFFTPILHPWPPFLFSPHPMTPFFHFCIKFYIQYCGYFNIKFANFGLKLHFCTLNEPYLCESTPKKTPYFCSPHRITPSLLLTKSYTECPYFSSPVGTYTSLSIIRVPPPPLILTLEHFNVHGQITHGGTSR